MGSIKILDSLTANKIAAGEIVEGPASVIKELLENSLDAQANYIEVEIKEGGLNLIKVSDNGIGMDKDDALLSLERHATSKIKDTLDLFNINTFGFRGEALPSIASVSTFIITTKDQEAISGTKIKVVGGKLQDSQEIASTPGTTIEVRNLFFNTPARRKFLKGISYETGQVTELITKYSLGHPNVRFKLINNQKVIYDTAGLNTVNLRLNNLYGEDLQDKFMHLPKIKDRGFTIEGWLAPPTFHRNTRNQQTFFINGRLVKSLEISKALEEGYHTLLPKGRFPMAVVDLQIDSTNLDVNIHPAKLQVKIFNIEIIKEKISRLFNQLLVNSNIVVAASPRTFTSNNIIPTFSNHKTSKAEPILKQADVEQTEYVQEELAQDTFWQNTVREDTAKEINQQSVECNHVEQVPSIGHYTEPMEEKVERVTVRNIPDLIPIGQLNNSFILAQNRNGLYIIDQHTCHERILYEKFLEEEKAKELTEEPLLIPVTLNLTGKQEGILLKNIVVLKELGFTIESFGTRTYLLRSLPIGLKLENSEQFFVDLLEDLDGAANFTIAKIKEKIIIMAACKSAVKANEKLSKEEMINLLKDLAKVNNAHTCPHGRPIFHKISMQQLYTIFQRGEYRGA